MYIIIIPQHRKTQKIEHIADLCIVDFMDRAIVFHSRESAEVYKEIYHFEGVIIEIPVKNYPEA